MLAAGIVLASLNLRTAVTSVGAVMGDVQAALGISELMAGVLATLPVLAFAALGAIVPALLRRCGYRLLISVSLLLMSAGLLARAFVSHIGWFLLFSAVALAAGAIGNVAIPGVVKKHFPGHIGLMTTAYSTALTVGATLGAALTVPFGDVLGGWRFGIAVWALPALLAAIPWLLWRESVSTTEQPPGERLRGLWRSKLAWMMMIFFGLQSGGAFALFGWLAQLLRDQGISPATAGAMFGFYNVIAIPMFLVIPVLAARHRNQRGILCALMSLFPLSLAGLWFAGGPSWLTWVWVGLLGVSMTTFSLILVLFALRTRTHEGTAALSAFAQSGGYLVAAISPLVIGAAYGATGSWGVPMLILLAAGLGQLLAGWYATSDRFLEDELAHLNGRTSDVVRQRASQT
ncbi:MFS transporter [Natronoglycomyces albus]|uniref:MFS transporter n=1 Tax=Natronoglycomyces albus TaxID=2811108 RepID=A0A895XRU5_9ACTN|nr:MFS transporter [Natronoglycomyces albus]QSB04980.1 MFS transporter [Natronoglycomyces albus]